MHPDQIEAYRRDGFVFPIEVFSRAEVEGFRDAFAVLLESSRGYEPKRFDRLHLFFDWAHQVVTHKALLDVVEGILGDDILLMVDINGNYTPDIALESLRAIEPYRIHWCEEPLPPTDVRGYAELRARSPIPIAAGEAFQTAHTFKRFTDARALDILQPGVSACGGFGEARAIATLAALENLRISPTGWGGAVTIMAGLHFAASIPIAPHTDNVPYPILLEFDVGANPLRDRLVEEPIWPSAGGLELPKRPGLGITLNPDGVAALRVRG